MRPGPRRQLAIVQRGKFKRCALHQRLRELLALVDVAGDKDNHRRFYRTLEIFEQDPFVVFVELGEIRNANHAARRHHRQLLGFRDGRVRIAVSEADRNVVELAQERIAHCFIRNRARGLVAKISFRTEKEINALDRSLLQGLGEIFWSSNRHGVVYLSAFTPNPLISVETIDSAKLRAMRITAGSSSLKKLRGSLANSNSPRKTKF